MGHFESKLWRTLQVVTCLALARTFGTYHHSVYADGVSYAVYEWRGDFWAIPTGPMEYGP